MANTWGGTYYNITNERVNVSSVLSADGNIWVAQRHNKKLSLYPELSLVEQGAFFVTALLLDLASGRCRLLLPLFFLLYCALLVCSYLGLSCLHPAHGFSSAPRAPSLLFFLLSLNISGSSTSNWLHYLETVLALISLQHLVCIDAQVAEGVHTDQHMSNVSLTPRGQ